MTYNTIKAGIEAIIESKSLSKSEQIYDFLNASPNEYGETYILFPESGDMSGNEKESLADRVYDKQVWRLKVAYSIGTHAADVNLMEINRKREELIKAIDNPANWTTYARMLNVIEWENIVSGNYILVNIKIEVTDTITY